MPTKKEPQSFLNFCTVPGVNRNSYLSEKMMDLILLGILFLDKNNVFFPTSIGEAVL